jgi:hypothetical protein
VRHRVAGESAPIVPNGPTGAVESATLVEASIGAVTPRRVRLTEEGDGIALAIDDGDARPHYKTRQEPVRARDVGAVKGGCVRGKRHRVQRRVEKRIGDEERLQIAVHVSHSPVARLRTKLDDRGIERLRNEVGITEHNLVGPIADSVAQEEWISEIKADIVERARAPRSAVCEGKGRDEHGQRALEWIRPIVGRDDGTHAVRVRVGRKRIGDRAIQPDPHAIGPGTRHLDAVAAANGTDERGI